MSARLSLFIALLVGLALGIYATIPPAPRGIDAPATQFSAARAMADIRVIAARPHPTGSAENAAVRAYIQQRMAALGMEVLTDPAPLSARSLKRLNRWSGRQDAAVTLTNVIGILPGRDRTLPAVALMAHHDTVWGSPGAADDTTGVAASLEVVRAIKAAGQPERDLIVLLTDAEELGLDGARHFFANNPLRNRIGAIINLEARGGGGRANMFQTSRANGEAMRLYATHAEQPAASSLAAFIYSVLPNDTDLTPALEGSYTAYNLAFIGRSGLYHSPLSTPETLDQGAVQDIGNQTLDLAGALLARDGIPGKAPDAVFFDWLGLVTVHYPAGLGWVMLGLAVLGFGWAARRDGAAGLGGGVLRFVGLVIIAGLLTYGFNWISLGGGRGEYYDRLAAIPRLEGTGRAGLPRRLRVGDRARAGHDRDHRGLCRAAGAAGKLWPGRGAHGGLCARRTAAACGSGASHPGRARAQCRQHCGRGAGDQLHAAAGAFRDAGGRAGPADGRGPAVCHDRVAPFCRCGPRSASGRRGLARDWQRDWLWPLRCGFSSMPRLKQSQSMPCPAP